MIMRLSVAALRPNRAGNMLYGTVGVLNVPMTGFPSFATMATGRMQLWVHVSLPFAYSAHVELALALLLAGL